MLALISLMVILTVGLKVLRFLRAAWFRRHFRRIEPALENFMLTGDEQPELLALRPWKRDLFLSRLIVERMVYLKGAGREFLMRLADELGLVDRYLKALDSRRRWRRARSAENLGYFGGARSVRPLGMLLTDEDETIRAVAARALARIGNDEAVRLLASTLDTPSELTRLRVAENLERVGKPAVGHLIASLSDVTSFGTKNLHGPIMAARVLGHLRAAEARDVLRRAAKEGKEIDLRAQAVLALGKIGNPDDVPAILEGADDEAWPVRAQSANALGMIGEVTSIPVLKDLASDREWWVRLNACRALVNMGPEGEKALLEILACGDRYARDRAAAILESRGVTRRMVKNLTKPGKRGERARAIVRAVIRSGSTKYLRGLAEGLPKGEERDALLRLLAEGEEGRDGVPRLVEEAERLETEMADPEASGDKPTEAQVAVAEPPGANLVKVDPEGAKQELNSLLEVASPEGTENSDGARKDGER